MERGFRTLLAVLRELPLYESIISPFFRLILRWLTWPLVRLTLHIVNLDRRTRSPETRERVQSMLEHWLRGAVFLLAASRNMEEVLFGWVPLFAQGEERWIAFAGRLMLASTVVEAMPPDPVDVLRRKRRCGFRELLIWFRSPRKAWRIWQPDLFRLLMRHLSRSSPVLVILTTIAPGWVGWVSFGLALSQYLAVGIITCRIGDSSLGLLPVAGSANLVVGPSGSGHPGLTTETDDSQLTGLERRQKNLAHQVRMVAREYSAALLVYSRQGGTGKSHTVTETLAAEGITPILINSHVTPLELYRLLYEYRDNHVLFFDDVDSIFRSLPHLGLLRSALFGEPRVVTYLSSQLDKGLPRQFIFESRVVFCVNTLPKKNPAFEAVLTRCDFVELSATNEELLELMRAIAGRGYGPMSADECLEVVDFIEQHAGDVGLSLRMLKPSFNRVLYAREEGIDWQSLVRAQLQAMHVHASNGVPQRLRKVMDEMVTPS